MAPMVSALDSSTLLQTALDSSPRATLIADGHGKIVLVNGELERQFGYARGDLVGQPVAVLIPEGLRPLTPDAGPPTEVSAEEAPRESIARRKDGSSVTVEIGLQSIQTRDQAFVLATIIDLDARRRQQNDRRAALPDQLEFERLIADLSVQFINVSDDHVDEAIRNGLRRIDAQLGVDGSALFRIDADGMPIERITSTAAEVGPATPPRSRRELFPWTFEQILSGHVVAFSRIDEVASETDRASYRTQGTKSAVVVPLSVATV